MTYQICLQSIIQCVEYEFAVVKFVEQDCQKQKDICVILWMYITSPPPPPPPLSTTDIGLINDRPYFWGTNHPCTNSKRWPSWLLRLSAPIWYFAIFPLAFKPIHADIKKWLYAVDCQMPAQISEYSGKNLPICHKPTLNCCSKSAFNWWERYYLHIPAYIWQNCS